MVKERLDSSTEPLNEGGGLTDLAKKIFLTGLGAVSMGERLPKEALSFVMDQAERRKDDLVERLAVEVSKFLEKLDISQELQKALKGMEIDINATLRFSGKSKEGEASSISIETKRRKSL